MQVGSIKACELAGISYRQLDYWDRTGLVCPTIEAQGSGSSRVYSQRDVDRLKLCSQLLRAGFSLQAVRELLEEFPDAVGGIMLVVTKDGLSLIPIEAAA